MKTFTYISLDPHRDSYDIVFLNDRVLLQGDYYHVKVEDYFKGIKLYLQQIGEDFNVAHFDATAKQGDFYDYDYAVGNESLQEYLERIKENFNIIQCY